VTETSAFLGLGYSKPDLTDHGYGGNINGWITCTESTSELFIHTL